MNDLFRVGVLSGTHGLKGDVKVYPTTDDPEKFMRLKEVFLDTKKEMLTMKIAAAKPYKNMYLLRFEGYEDINLIEKYSKCELYVGRENAVPLEDGEHYIADLIGLKVVTDTDEDFGTVKDIMRTGANDVYVVDKDGQEVLIPSIPDCILSVDLEEGVVTVHLLKGLI